tara:strand:- start:792 stop:1571 length:780 start_codon:yes stop_codon:yes gene_type:complete
MNQTDKFKKEVRTNIQALGADGNLQKQSLDWMLNAALAGSYSYNFEWMGRPIIQYPQDIVALQELVYSTRPDLIIETGIAHGGSLILSASLLALLDLEDAISTGATINPKDSDRKVIGLDIDIRTHNLDKIMAHPMSSRIQMIEGSSIATEVVDEVKAIASDYQRILVILDSNHTHDHVLAELNAYAPLVCSGSYCVVFDTVINDTPGEFIAGRPWGPGNNPKTAVWEYLKTHPEFEIDKQIDNKLLISVAPDGYLIRK